jgi:hypothetical protein
MGTGWDIRRLTRELFTREFFTQGRCSSRGEGFWLGGYLFPYTTSKLLLAADRVRDDAEEWRETSATLSTDADGLIWASPDCGGMDRIEEERLVVEP